jgi:predicted nucleic acid-binding protein
MNPVVIDTNCLLQIISHGSPYRPIWDAFLAGQYTLCVSNEILDEYQEILEQQATANHSICPSSFLLAKNNKIQKLFVSLSPKRQTITYYSIQHDRQNGVDEKSCIFVARL